MQTTVPFDVSDPLIVIITWGLTVLLSKLPEGSSFEARIRNFIPAIAVLLAVAVRSGIDAANGEPFTVGTLLRALAAGAVAVLTHSQFREVVKILAPEESPPPPVDPGHSAR